MSAAECQCDAAVRNRKRLDGPRPATFPPNADGEVVCRFCWRVLEAPS